MCVYMYMYIISTYISMYIRTGTHMYIYIYMFCYIGIEFRTQDSGSTIPQMSQKTRGLVVFTWSLLRLPCPCGRE